MSPESTEPLESALSDSPSPMQAVGVDLQHDVGRFRALQGVNNGPVCLGGAVNLTPWHEQLDLPCTRLHDCDWPDPVVVDIPAIFPDVSADPEDASNYHFRKTDDYL